MAQKNFTCPLARRASNFLNFGKKIFVLKNAQKHVYTCLEVIKWLKKILPVHLPVGQVSF